MSLIETFPSMEGLTTDQKMAIAELWKNQQGRAFVGVSIGICINDFRDANSLLKSNPEKAKTNEAALFALCGYTPQQH